LFSNIKLERKMRNTLAYSNAVKVFEVLAQGEGRKRFEA
jgi:hypothetical protein